MSISDSNKEFLSIFGWSGFFESQSPQSDLNLYPARVIGEERNLYRIQLNFEDTRWASISGKMQFQAAGRADFPAVGDWVLVEVPGATDRGVIHFIYPRKSCIQRKQAGNNLDIQIIATNVDYVFITTSLNEDLNSRRLERYLVMVWEAGCVPILLLTKSDLCSSEELELKVKNLQQQFIGVDIYATAQDSFDKAEFFLSYLKEGKTCVVVGSSGVGKSTLVNFLIGRQQIRTQEIREKDDRGKHTTTSRFLYVSRLGGLIIDSPGMRELQLSDHEDGVRAQFSEVERLISRCRFGDCQHRTEPGCAVLQALDSGELLADLWQSYQKLAAEVRHQMRKRDKALASEDKKAWKKMNQQMKVRVKGKNW